MDENDKLMNLPYGEAFKKCWEEYVQFMYKQNRDTSIKAQNCVLRNYLRRNYTEQQAIDKIHRSQNFFIKHFLRQES